MSKTSPTTEDIPLDSEQIDVSALHAIINRENNIFILDVRTPDEYETWRVEGLYTPDTINIPFHDFMEDQDEAVKQVPQGRSVVVVCAEGAASDLIAAALDESDRHAVNLILGMEAWGAFYVARPVVEAKAYQIYQVDRVARGCLSYILISNNKVAIIDPLRHLDQYHQLLADKGADLALILDTHAHADHISGGPELAAASGAPYYLHPYDGIHPFDMLPAKIPYEMLKDGQTFTLGQLTIEVIHVPGHTLGQVNYLVTAPDGQSYFFTGDNLFIESFGRPDLGGQGESWAPIVYETIFERVKSQVPESAWVLPGHYAQFKEANADGLFAKQLADLWRENSGLQFASREAFVAYVLANLPKLPEEYIEIKRVNIGLSEPTEEEASELELGKNICALSTAY